MGSLRNELGNFQIDVSEWSQHNFGDQPSWKPLLGAGEELGELYHAYLKASQNIRGDAVAHKEKMEDAVGDIVVYLADFCGREGLALGHCVADAWHTASARDWVKYPKNGRTE